MADDPKGGLLHSLSILIPCITRNLDLAGSIAFSHHGWPLACLRAESRPELEFVCRSFIHGVSLEGNCRWSRPSGQGKQPQPTGQCPGRYQGNAHWGRRGNPLWLPFSQIGATRHPTAGGATLLKDSGQHQGRSGNRGGQTRWESPYGEIAGILLDGDAPCLYIG